MKYLFFLVFTFISIALRAQLPSELYQSAKEAYEKNDNAKAISLLAYCESALGKTNPRIESLRAFCYANQGDWVNSSVAITMYFRMVSSSVQETNAHKDLLALREKVNAELANADRQFKKELDNGRMKSAVQFEEQEATAEKTNAELLRKESEANMYQLYRNSTNPDELQEFLKMFPSSTRAGEITFKKYVANGDLALKEKRWNIAIEEYTKALALKSDASVQATITHAKDEQFFASAIRNNDLTDYENYLSHFPAGIHKKDADEVLQKNYLRLAREFAVAGNFDETVKYYKTYNTRYPQGPDIEVVKTELCRFYLTEAQKAEQTMDTYSIRRALDLYALAQQCGTLVPESHIQSLNRKVKRWSRPNLSFLGWHADQVNMAGIMTGSLNNKSIGMYISARMGKGFTETVAEWKTDNTNSLAESPTGNKVFTGEILSKTIHANIGLTKKIVHPLWVYAGGGLTFNNELRQFRTQLSGTEEYVENKDAKFTSFNGELGVYIVLKPFVFRYGINKPFHEKYTGSVIQNFGLGIIL